MEKTEVNRLTEYKTDENLSSSRPSYLEIDLEAFRHNFSNIKKLAGEKSSIMAVVKANAYGHGLIPIAREALKLGADFLGVAFVEEGERLLRDGINAKIAVLYPDMPERAARLVQSGFIATVDSPEYLEALSEASKACNKTTSIFIKAETGMGRFGASAEEIKALVQLANELPGIELMGISTNLADSSNGDTSFTDGQFAAFNGLANQANLLNGHYLSIENSSGLLFHHDNNYNLVRVGLLMYGYLPKKIDGMSFKPVMSLKSKLIQIRPWPAGKPIGYGGKYTPQRDILLATVGVGYADGYPWALSNKSQVLIRGKRANVVGRVCMDALMIDVTDIPSVGKGDEVVLLGRSGDEVITADELGELAGSFSYEIIAGMSERLPRVYVGG